VKTITLPDTALDTILGRLRSGAFLPELAAEQGVVTSTLRKILLRQRPGEYAEFANRTPPTKEQRPRKPIGRPTPEIPIDAEAVAVFTGYMPTTTGLRLRWI